MPDEDILRHDPSKRKAERVREGVIGDICGLGPNGLLFFRLKRSISKKKKTLLQLVLEGVNCALEAASFDDDKSTLHKIDVFLNSQTDIGDILSEMVDCKRKGGTVSIISPSEL